MLKKKINFNRTRKLMIGGNIKKLRLSAGTIEAGMIKRTQRGLDVKLKSFDSYAPYSDEYKAYKRKKGRSGGVDLTFTGNMLNSITHKNIPRGVRFYFNAKTQRDKARWNMKTRYFFGADKKQISWLKGYMQKL